MTTTQVDHQSGVYFLQKMTPIHKLSSVSLWVSGDTQTYDTKQTGSDRHPGCIAENLGHSTRLFL